MKKLDKTANCAENGSKSTDITKKKKNKFFYMFKIKDIVFIAIMGALVLLLGSYMPLLLNVHLFGIIQIGLGIQFSLIPAIVLMKVRKPGSLFIFSLLVGCVLCIMNPIMLLNNVVTAFVAECLVLLIFRSYKNDLAVFLASWIYLPLSLPLLFLLDVTMKGRTVEQAIRNNPLYAILGSIGAIAVTAIGAGLGIFIGRELEKAGVLKANEL